MPRPKHLTWEESGCYVLTLATAYRMLFGHSPHTLKPGHNVLVWGGAGGLGSMAIQVIAASGGNAIAVISDEDKREFVESLGAKGVINRTRFDCWGQLPDLDDGGAFAAYMKKVREFGKAIWEITGKGNDVDIVFEHPGEATFPVSVFVVKRGGMVVICAGTTGYNLTLDARFLWMRQKRVQGSHFANLKQASAANDMVLTRKVDPCMSEVFAWSDIPRAHDKMRRNQHKPGNMAVLVQARRPACARWKKRSRAERGAPPRVWRPRDRGAIHGSVPCRGGRFRADRSDGRCLAAADLLLARATDAVRARVAPRGMTDPALLEREQHAVHGLAWLATYVEALRQMHAWALRLEGLGRFASWNI